MDKKNVNKKKIIPLLLVAIIAVGGGAYYYHDQQVKLERAAHLTLSGNVDVREVSLAFRSSDRIAEILVEEGAAVKKGQVLAKLESRELTLAIDKLKAQVKAQESIVAKLKNGSRSEEIEQAAARLRAAQAERDFAVQDLSMKQGAMEASKGRSVSQQDVAAAQSKSDAADAKVVEAGNALELLVQGPRTEDIAQAEAQLDALKEELKRQEYVLSQYELRASNDGVIRSRLLEPGDMASPQKPVFKLSLTDKKWVRAYVNETDLGRIFEGQSAKVYIDSYPDKPLIGQIGYISSTAEFTPKTVQTDELRTALVYEVRVYVDDTDNVLRMGMPATVKL